MFFKEIIKMFRMRNVCVCGLRGDGKDMLFGNVIARRKEPYISQFSYTKDPNLHQVLDFGKLDCGKNSWKDMITGYIKYYKFPYIEGSDIYISDAGVYMPSQYCNELNKYMPYLPTYFALSRQVSHNNIHVNVQHLGRVWDKIREQSDIYIRCRFCTTFIGKKPIKSDNKVVKILTYIPSHIIIQKVTLYDKYQSAADRVEPCKIRVPMMAKREVKQNAAMYVDKFRNTYGSISNHWLIYWNKSTYDTHYFKKLFLGGIRNECEENENTKDNCAS